MSPNCGHWTHTHTFAALAANSGSNASAIPAMPANVATRKIMRLSACYQTVACPQWITRSTVSAFDRAAAGINKKIKGFKCRILIESKAKRTETKATIQIEIETDALPSNSNFEFIQSTQSRDITVCSSVVLPGIPCMRGWVNILTIWSVACTLKFNICKVIRLNSLKIFWIAQNNFHE